MKNALRINASMTTTAILTKLLAWIVVLSVAGWVVLGLVSLRFELGGNWEDVFYTQVIIAGMLLIAIANAGAMRAGVFSMRAVLAQSPVLWALMVTVALAMLIHQVWTDFSGPVALTKTMYSLLGVGLCGTYAALLSLLSFDPVYRLLRWAMYALTFILATQVLDGLQVFEGGAFDAEQAGHDFGTAAMAVAVILALYAVFAAIGAIAAGKLRNANYAFIGFSVVGLIGFTGVLFALWDEYDAGPFRLILGASQLLAIFTMGLTMLHYHQRGLPWISRWVSGKAPAESPGEDAAEAPA